jgi:hypothetical protein
VTESFLHYLWQFQYFDKHSLATHAGEAVQVFHPGIRNTHAGPDFSDARILIGALEWRGSVEIHIQSSGWLEHRHSDDAAYEKVILHVVWENDKPIVRSDGSLMPTLELKNRVDLTLWGSYKKLITGGDGIPCSGMWNHVNDVVKLSMFDKVVIQRLEHKAQFAIGLLKDNLGDWEETTYQLLMKNFGFKVNADSFLQLARSIPFKLIHKHRDHPAQVEALLFGQAGFLDDLQHDDYAYRLSHEYTLLGKKYSLLDRKMHASQWRFLRMRPANFPTVRLAQVAAVLIRQAILFSELHTSASVSELSRKLMVPQSAYWQHHYQPGKPAAHVPMLGKTSAHNIIINTLVPLLVAYSLTHDDPVYMDRAINVLQQLPAEKNSITRHWSSLGQDITSSFDSQACIELYNAYCLKKRCLECAVGASLIKPA